MVAYYECELYVSLKCTYFRFYTVVSCLFGTAHAVHYCNYSPAVNTVTLRKVRPRQRGPPKFPPAPYWGPRLDSEYAECMITEYKTQDSNNNDLCASITRTTSEISVTRGDVMCTVVPTCMPIIHVESIPVSNVATALLSTTTRGLLHTV